MSYLNNYYPPKFYFDQNFLDLLIRKLRILLSRFFGLNIEKKIKFNQNLIKI